MLRRRTGSLLVAAGCIGCFVPVWWAPVAALALALAGTLLCDRTVVRASLRAGLLLAGLLAAAIAGAAVTWSAGMLRGVEAGGTLLARLLVLLLATGLLARSVDAEAVVRLSGRLGLEGIGLVLGLSLNTLPRLVDMIDQVWIALRMRARSRLHLLRLLPRLVEVVLAHTARLAEEASAAAALRGHTGLSTRTLPLVVPVRLVVVTGPTNAGKTTVVAQVAEQLRASGQDLSGIVQPGIWEQGKKTGFLVRDLHTGQEALLAHRVASSDGQHGTGFRFSDQGLALAAAALGRAGSGSVLIVDELGPVELRGAGHMLAVRQALGCPGLVAALVVVRRHLVPSLLAALDAEDAEVIDIGQHGDQAVTVILGALGCS